MTLPYNRGTTSNARLRPSAVLTDLITGSLETLGLGGHAVSSVEATSAQLDCLDIPTCCDTKPLGRPVANPVVWSRTRLLSRS